MPIAKKAAATALRSKKAAVVAARAKKAARDQVLRVLRDVAGGSTVTAAAEAEGLEVHTILMRIRKDEELSGLYLEVKQARALAIADEMLTLADEAPEYTENGVDPAWVQWQRNRIETRKWLTGKLYPAEFGAKVGEVSAAGGGVKVQINIGMDIPEPAAQPLEANNEGWG